MGSEGEELERKRVVPLSTVSLDSTYDEDGSPAAEKQPLRKRCSWAPFVLLVGLILVAVGLVLALDRDNSGSQDVVDVEEGDPSFSTAQAALTSGRVLTAPQKKLVGWMKQMQNASELYVEGGSSNTSLTGVVFPRNDSEESLPLPFDAMVAIDSGLIVYNRQYVALADDKGYKWTDTQLGYGDSITTNGCLGGNNTSPFPELGSVVTTANWTSDDADDKSEVDVVFDGEVYTVWKDEDDDAIEAENSRCWSIESKDEDFGLRLCVPSPGEQLSKAKFEEVFEATTGCPRLAPNATTREKFSVPLPLHKWYASYMA